MAYEQVQLIYGTKQALDKKLKQLAMLVKTNPKLHIATHYTVIYLDGGFKWLLTIKRG